MAVVRYFGKLKGMTGKSQETMAVDTIRSLLREIKTAYGEEAYQTAKRGHIIVDGKNAGSYGGFGMKLTEENVIQLLPVCGGG